MGREVWVGAEGRVGKPAGHLTSALQRSGVCFTRGRLRGVEGKVEAQKRGRERQRERAARPTRPPDCRASPRVGVAAPAQKSRLIV